MIISSINFYVLEQFMNISRDGYLTRYHNGMNKTFLIKLGMEMVKWCEMQPFVSQNVMQKSQTLNFLHSLTVITRYHVFPIMSFFFHAHN